MVRKLNENLDFDFVGYLNPVRYSDPDKQLLADYVLNVLWDGGIKEFDSYEINDFLEEHGCPSIPNNIGPVEDHLEEYVRSIVDKMTENW